MPSLVSVVIPAFNAASRLPDTLESVLRQSHRDIEVLLVDDGSTDHTAKVAKRCDDSRLTLIRQENRGGSHARNAGLAAAKGDFVQFLDADDLLSPDKIARQLDLLLRSPRGCLAVSGVVYFFDEDDPETGTESPGYPELNSDDPAEWLAELWTPGPGYGASRWGMVPVHSWLSPRDVLAAAGPWNESLIKDQDGEYFCRAVLASRGIRWEPDSRVYYRKYREPISVSAQTSEAALASRLRSVELKAAALSRKVPQPWPDKLRRAVARQCMDVAFAATPRLPNLAGDATAMASRYGGYDAREFLEYNQTAFLASKLIGWRRTRILLELYRRVVRRRRSPVGR